MRTIVTFIFLIYGTSISCWSQGIGINQTGAPPDSSALLDISSTHQGFLTPRMTAIQRDSISDPVAGLIVYCSNCGTNGGEMQVYNGSSWRNMVGGAASLPGIGQSYQGGILAYILQPGDPGYIAGESHGLIAAPTDQSNQMQWGCYLTEIEGADGTALGTGYQNTIDIIAGCETLEIAARLCDNLVLNGFSDWYLPSKDELNILFVHAEAIGGFAPGPYWSSSEHSSDYAWYQIFDFGAQIYDRKSYSWNIRAVRAF